jgi:hypothetical protein
MPKERILITVKTYPTLSASYGELVCTAGLRENGSWIRIYPVPFRRLEEYQKFEKYRIIEAQVIRNTKDPRPESHKIDFQSLELTETKLSTADSWRERRNWVLARGRVHDDLTTLIAAANERNETSLATFKPAELLDFKAEPQSPNWDEKKVITLQEASKQGDLFPEWQPQSITKLVNKLPWKFSYRFLDSHGRESTMMIEDWEIGALYWKCIQAGATAEEAVGKVRQMYWDNFASKDLYLFLGTTREWHGRGKNPFVVVGVFYPPLQTQPELFTDS